MRPKSIKSLIQDGLDFCFDLKGYQNLSASLGQLSNLADIKLPCV